MSQKSYENYWWRWIKMLWGSFDEFMNDMREDYLQFTKEHWINNTTIDRIDVNWNYCKENCKYVTRAEQGSNRRDTLNVDIDWEIYTSRKLADELWISVHAAYGRLMWLIEWRLSKDMVFSKERLKVWQYKRKDRIYITIEWQEYCSTTISELCWITKHEASARIKKYKLWKIDTNKLLKWATARLKKDLVD